MVPKRINNETNDGTEYKKVVRVESETEMNHVGALTSNLAYTLDKLDEELGLDDQDEMHKVTASMNDDSFQRTSIVEGHAEPQELFQDDDDNSKNFNFDSSDVILGKQGSIGG